MNVNNEVKELIEVNKKSQLEKEAIDRKIELNNSKIVDILTQETPLKIGDIFERGKDMVCIESFKYDYPLFTLQGQKKEKELIAVTIELNNPTPIYFAARDRKIRTVAVRASTINPSGSINVENLKKSIEFKASLMRKIISNCALISEDDYTPKYTNDNNGKMFPSMLGLTKVTDKSSSTNTFFIEINNFNKFANEYRLQFDDTTNTEAVDMFLSEIESLDAYIKNIDSAISNTASEENKDPEQDLDKYLDAENTTRTSTRGL